MVDVTWCDLCIGSHTVSSSIFTITAEILACSLANFYCQYAQVSFSKS